MVKTVSSESETQAEDTKHEGIDVRCQGLLPKGIFPPPTWPVFPVHTDHETSVQSYREGMEECELAEEMGFDWLRSSRADGSLPPAFITGMEETSAPR